MTTIIRAPSKRRRPSAPSMGASTSSACSRPPTQINEALRTARHAFAAWRDTPLAERAAILTRFCDEFEKRGADKIAEELTWQMGRPARYAPNEVRGTLERARHMIAIAPAGARRLSTSDPKDNFKRFVRREPLGVVFTVAAWNYPYLIAVNSVVPALMAGNAVILKHSAQTPLCAERFAECLEAAGLPSGRVPGAARLARGHRPDHPRSAHRLRRVHGFRRRRPCRAARRGLAFHRRRARARRLRSGVRAARCQPRARHREHRRRRVLQFRPIVLRTAARVRARAGVRQIHRRLRRADAQVRARRSDRCGHHARAAGAHRGRRRRAHADRGVDRGRRAAGVIDEARVREVPSRARRISRRRCC